jgi:hypothetical protein
MLLFHCLLHMINSYSTLETLAQDCRQIYYNLKVLMSFIESASQLLKTSS